MTTLTEGGVATPSVSGASGPGAGRGLRITHKYQRSGRWAGQASGHRVSSGPRRAVGARVALVVVGAGQPVSFP